MDSDTSKVSRSPKKTQQLGMKVARHLQPNDVIALTGQIGAGKTTFVQGVAQGLGVPLSSVGSPSFVLVREYRGRMPIHHADLFRLERLPEAATVGLEEYYESDGVTLIEWANKLPGVLPEQFLEIRFEVVNPKIRKISLFPHGSRYEGRKFFQ